MEVPFSVLLLLLLVVAATGLVAFYAYQHLSPNPAPVSVPVSNVIPLRNEVSSTTIVYHVNFRIACGSQPMTLTEFIVGVAYGGGDTASYVIRAVNGQGFHQDAGRNVNVTVGLSPATSLVCGEADYNMGRDMSVMVMLRYRPLIYIPPRPGEPLSYYADGAMSYGVEPFSSTQLLYVKLRGTMPSGRAWEAGIYLPEYSFRVGG